MRSTIGAVMGKEAPRSDRDLLTSVRVGDQAAREELARRVGNTAYVFALQLTGGSDVADDVAQDSVLRFFLHLDRFDADRPIDPWLYQIVRNRVRDLIRRDRLRRAGVPAYVLPIRTDRTRRYQLYSGAYETAAAAETLGLLLARGGVDAILVARRGEKQ